MERVRFVRSLTLNPLVPVFYGFLKRRRLRQILLSSGDTREGSCSFCKVYPTDTHDPSKGVEILQ